MQSQAVLTTRDQTNLARYGVTNPASLDSVKEKQRETCLARLGVPYASQHADVKAKRRSTWSRYPNQHPMNDPDVQARRQDTMVTTYGHASPIMVPEIREKIQATVLARYGHVNAMHSPEIAKKVSNALTSAEVRNKTKQNNLARYGVEYPRQAAIKDQLILLDDPQWLQQQVQQLGQVGVAELLGVSVDTVRKYVTKHAIKLPKIGSTFEKQVHALIQNHYQGTVMTNNRTIIGQELDIVLPDLRLAIECNGTYWHSELNGRTRSYHLDKLIQAQAQGYELIQIWEHDWSSRRAIVESRIKTKLGVNQRIAARTCQVIDLSSSVTAKFLDANHIQGKSASSVRLGLQDASGTLVAVMTFGRARYNKQAAYELMRFASSINTTVVGGASKLFSHFMKIHGPTTVVSYSDRSMNHGGVYALLGFKLIHYSPPAYHYTRNYRTIFSRIKFQKHQLASKLEHYDPNLSEWANMMANGYDRIWDCGTATWLFS